MQLDQETFNILFKEIFDLDSLPNKDREELTQQYQYYDNTMRKFLNALTINNQIMIMKLSYCIDLLPNLQRFIKQWWLKKSIFRSKASTFQPTIYNSLSNMYDSKQGIFISIIQSIFSECKLQIEIAHRKLTNDDIEKRIHSQDQGSQNNQYLQQSSQGSITQLLLQKKSPYPEWQINNMKNKNLSQYYKNLFKLYDLLLIDKMQEDQILYFQSKEQNLEKLYQQLIQQNTHIKKSFNWAATIDTNEFEKHNQQLQIKENLTIQNIQATTVNIIKTDQFDCQKTGISFLSSNEKYKVRSYSQNSKVKDLYSYSDKIKHFCPNYQESIKFRIPQSHLGNQKQYQSQLAQHQILKQSSVINMLTRKRILNNNLKIPKKQNKTFGFKIDPNFLTNILIYSRQLLSQQYLFICLSFFQEMLQHTFVLIFSKLGMLLKTNSQLTYQIGITF